MVESDSPVFNDSLGKKNMFTAAAGSLCPLFQKNLIFLPRHSPMERHFFKIRKEFFKKPSEPRNRDLGIKIIAPNIVVTKKDRKPNFRSSLEKTFKKNPENEDWNYNSMEFKMEVIKESTACSAWEYIRFSLTPAEIKI